EFRDVLEKLRREGFVRVRVDGETIELGGPAPVRLDKTRSHRIEAVVDRLVIRPDIRQRLSDSVATALKWGAGQLVVLIPPADPLAAPVLRNFSVHFADPDTGFTLPALTPRHFSFYSHLGACPACEALGR